jgi:hypothetical protein
VWTRRKLLAALQAQAADGHTELGGIIRTDTKWSASESPYLITAPVQVAEGVTLIVEPGVRVASQGPGTEFAGRVIANGTADVPIVFAAAEGTSMATEPFTAFQAGPYVSLRSLTIPELWAGSDPGAESIAS